MGDEKYFDQDAELAHRAKEGDRDAFGTLVEKYQGAMYSYALHFFRNPTRAEDVAQETFLRAFRFLHTYDPRRRFSTWLYTVARNLCIDRHRENVRNDHLDVETLHPRHLVGVQNQKSPLENLEDREDRGAPTSAARAATSSTVTCSSWPRRRPATRSIFHRRAPTRSAPSTASTTLPSC